MRIGIVGLGLIGASFAKAVKAYTDHSVYAFDINKDTLSFAEFMEIIDGELTDEEVSLCDYVFVSVYPEKAVEWIEENAKKLKKDSIVIDCCGVKEAVCQRCFDVARENGFTFIGGHPMAGYHKSGIKYSKATMFKGASMILVPENTEDISLLSGVTAFFKSIGFGSVTVTDAKTHDKNIAFTSQLAHVVSNAYVKSPQAIVHKGFSAGSYKDLTRVAYLNENMWAELFMENKEFLADEIDNIINELKKYSQALKDEDKEKLTALLKEGKERKELIDN
ncbi:MAG: prephenate dehydrogenase [Clostridia bacterium]|nr:prephenate dehydrogenase [Clostridia bacterium]